MRCAAGARRPRTFAPADRASVLAKHSTKQGGAGQNRTRGSRRLGGARQDRRGRQLTREFPFQTCDHGFLTSRFNGISHSTSDVAVVCGERQELSGKRAANAWRHGQRDRQLCRHFFHQVPGLRRGGQQPCMCAPANRDCVLAQPRTRSRPDALTTRAAGTVVVRSAGSLSAARDTRTTRRTQRE
jgi:hypothetical protein